MSDLCDTCQYCGRNIRFVRRDFGSFWQAAVTGPGSSYNCPVLEASGSADILHRPRGKTRKAAIGKREEQSSPRSPCTNGEHRTCWHCGAPIMRENDGRWGNHGSMRVYACTGNPRGHQPGEETETASWPATPRTCRHCGAGILTLGSSLWRTPGGTYPYACLRNDSGHMPAAIPGPVETAPEEDPEEKRRREQQAMIAGLGEAGYRSPWHTGLSADSGLITDYQQWRIARNKYAETGDTAWKMKMLGHVTADNPPLASDMMRPGRRKRPRAVTGTGAAVLLVMLSVPVLAFLVSGVPSCLATLAGWVPLLIFLSMNSRPRRKARNE